MPLVWLIILPKSTSTLEVCPCSPMSPETKASQPGNPILKCQGSLSVIVGGGGVSFGSSSSGPAATPATAANSATAKKHNFIFIARFCGRGCSNPRKIYWSLVDPRDFGALETKPGHQTLLVEGVVKISFNLCHMSRPLVLVAVWPLGKAELS